MKPCHAIVWNQSNAWEVLEQGTPVTLVLTEPKLTVLLQASYDSDRDRLLCVRNTKGSTQNSKALHHTLAIRVTISVSLRAGHVTGGSINKTDSQEALTPLLPRV